MEVTQPTFIMMNDLIQGALIGGGIGLVIGLIFAIQMKNQNAAKHVTVKPSKLTTYMVNGSFENLVAHLQAQLVPPYVLEHANEGDGRIILGDSFNWLKANFYYPIFVERLPDGSMKLEAGIMNKLRKSGMTNKMSAKKFQTKLAKALEGYQG